MGTSNHHSPTSFVSFAESSWILHSLNPVNLMFKTIFKIGRRGFDKQRSRRPSLKLLNRSHSKVIRIINSNSQLISSRNIT